jgi:hypothetical protein
VTHYESAMKDLMERLHSTNVTLTTSIADISAPHCGSCVRPTYRPRLVPSTASAFRLGPRSATATDRSCVHARGRRRAGDPQAADRELLPGLAANRGNGSTSRQGRPSCAPTSRSHRRGRSIISSSPAAAARVCPCRRYHRTAGASTTMSPCCGSGGCTISRSSTSDSTR